MPRDRFPESFPWSIEPVSNLLRSFPTVSVGFRRRCHAVGALNQSTSSPTRTPLPYHVRRRHRAGRAGMPSGVVSGLYPHPLSRGSLNLEPSPDLALSQRVRLACAWRPKRRPALGQCRPHGVEEHLVWLRPAVVVPASALPLRGRPCRATTRDVRTLPRTPSVTRPARPDGEFLEAFRPIAHGDVLDGNQHALAHDLEAVSTAPSATCAPWGRVRRSRNGG